MGQSLKKILPFLIVSIVLFAPITPVVPVVIIAIANLHSGSGVVTTSRQII